MQAQPPSWQPAAGLVPGAAPRGPRRALWIPLAVVVAVVLVAAAVLGGYALGHARAAAAQPPAGTVSAAFAHFRLAPGWTLADKTATTVQLQNSSDAFATVQVGDSASDHVKSNADVFRNQLYSLSRLYPGPTGSCLPLTRVAIGGKAGEEIGLLFRQKTPATQDYCDLVWADVQGPRYYLWVSQGPSRGLSQRVSATQAMQRTVVWTR